MKNMTLDPFSTLVSKNRITERPEAEWESLRGLTGSPLLDPSPFRNATLPALAELRETSPRFYSARVDDLAQLRRDPDVPPQNQQPGRKHGSEPGWLPDDDLTQEWLQAIKDYRASINASEED